MMFAALYPQIQLRFARGADYNNIYAYNDLDEAAYAAYAQALIDSRPRRSNPYTGANDAPESLFSVQFLPAYAVALPARIIGADASAAFIVAGAIAAMLTAWTMFRLLRALTDDALFAWAATLMILCGGVLLNGEGAISELLRGGAAYPYFPFLRRYVPAVPFPFFWLFCLAVWRLLQTSNNKIHLRIAYSALCFAVLVYSYFYLWTTAAAFLFCAAAVWLLFRPDGWQIALRRIGIVAALMLFALVPYAMLLAQRDSTMDAVQLLNYTRAPDLLRPPELLALLGLTVICYGFWRRLFDEQNNLALFAVGLSLVPFAVFNQQIVTGRSLQPIHYQVFIVNYVALFAFSLAIFLVWRNRADKLPRASRPILIVATLATCAWGLVEARLTTNAVSAANQARDEAASVSKRLREINQPDATVLPLNLLQGDDSPAFAPNPVLWARHQHVFAGEDSAANKNRFHHFLYFAGIDENELARQLQAKNPVIVIALFGWDKLSARLSSNPNLLTDSEIQTATTEFADFRRNFNVREAARHKLSFVITDADNTPDLSNLDRWYERDAGERIGQSMLFRVHLRH